MSIVERDRAAAWFAEEDSGAQVLLCSEIGSEGRNFQFASNLVMFDLPLTRICWSSVSAVWTVSVRRTIFRSTFRIWKKPRSPCWCAGSTKVWMRLNIPARPAAPLRSVHNDLIGYLAAPENTDGFDDLIKSCREKHDALKAQLEQAATACWRSTPTAEKAQALAESIEEQDDDTSLISFSMNLFDIVGINQDDRGENLIVLTPSDHMLVPDFPGLPEDGCTITFERDVALSREDAQFITWEHPLIRNGLDLILSGDTGSSTISC
jgi:ATP-dependent helicase HepA